MSTDNRQSDDLFDDIPFRSYEELVAGKRRKRRRRHGAVFIAVLFFFIVLVFINFALSLLGKPMLLESLSNKIAGVKKATSYINPVTAGTQPGLNGNLKIDINDTEGKTAAIYVKDVSAIVREARKSVVGVTCEIYSTFSSVSSGSGIIVSGDGYIVTNSHVVTDGGSITVTLDSGESYPAYIIGADEFTDIAVLKIEAVGLTAAVFGDSDLIEAGEAAIAIGNPTSMLQGTVTAGIISAVNRNVQVNSIVMNLIQTDAAINKGNSGGPLLNQYGQVVGINTLKISLSGYEGISFAIPINTAKPIIEQLADRGYVSGRPLVGMSGQNISKVAAAFYGVPQGVYIERIGSESPLVAAGAQPGDVITHVDGQRVLNLSEACSYRNGHTAGEEMTLTLFRKGETVDVKIVLMEQTKDNGSSNF